MTQVWLALLGAILLWQGDNWAQASENVAMVLVTSGYGCLIISVVLFFVNGGTTG